jgi:integrase
MRRREQARVLGPYQEDALWRIIEIDARGRRKSYTTTSRQAATRLMARIRANLGARTVQATISLWEAARLRSGVANPTTIAEQSTRVRAVLGPIYTLRIGDVTERKALALYDRATKEPTQKTGQPLRPATHRFYLYLVQSLWAWAHKQGYVQHNPWAEIEPVGRVSSGKPQLRPAEARRFAQRAEQEAAAGSGVALAALCCLSLGLRASEALGITARDFDAEAGEVYINGTKTAASKRRLKVPPSLATLLMRAAATRQPTERLCVASRQALHGAVIKLCARAGVPRVCVHALRGTHASLAVTGGASVEAVARVLGHTSTKMTLGHYVTEETATAARVAAVAASLSLPHHSDSISDPNSPTGGPTGSLLPSLSTSRQATARQAPAASAFSRPPDCRRHSAVCCCSLCELRGTGEQAMRSVGGDYRRFLARVGNIPSSLLSRSRDAASSLLAIALLLLLRRSA